MKALHLVLKRKWFEMIASGEKTEEYREIKPYWASRLLLSGDWIYLKQTYSIYDDDELMQIVKQYAGKSQLRWDIYSHVTFQLGYQKNAPRMTFEIEELSIGKGNPLWGAPDNEVFIIKLGKRV